MSYCAYCGAVKVEEETGRFDVKTGERLRREVCSKAPCEHDRHEYEYVTHNLFWPDSKKCLRCGKVVKEWE